MNLSYLITGPVYPKDACENGAYASRGLVWMYSVFQKVHPEGAPEAPSTDSRAGETVQMSPLWLQVCYIHV